MKTRRFGSHQWRPAQAGQVINVVARIISKEASGMIGLPVTGQGICMEARAGVGTPKRATTAFVPQPVLFGGGDGALGGLHPADGLLDHLQRHPALLESR